MYYVLPVVLSISSKSPVLHDAYAALVSLTWFCVYSGSVHPIPWQWFSAHHHGSTPLHCKISNKDQIIPPTKAIRTVLLWPAFWLLWNSTTMALSGVVIGLPGLLTPCSYVLGSQNVSETSTSSSLYMDVTSWQLQYLIQAPSSEYRI